MASVITEGRRTGEFIVSEANGYRSRSEITLLLGQVLAAGSILGMVTLGAAAGAKQAGAGDGAIGAVTLGAKAESGIYVLTAKGDTHSVANPTFAGTGDGVLTKANPAFSAQAQVGEYKITAIEPATDLGTFQVLRPDGSLDGIAKVGVAYDGQVKFTIDDGGTDFVAGDTFTLAVTAVQGANAGKFSVVAPSGAALADLTVGVAYVSDHINLTIADGAADWGMDAVIHVTVAAGSGKYKQYNPANLDGSQKAVAVLYDNVDATDADKQAVIFARDAEVNSNCLEWFAGASANQKAAGVVDLAAVGIVVR